MSKRALDDTGLGGLLDAYLLLNRLRAFEALCGRLHKEVVKLVREITGMRSCALLRHL
jgi:hypothetical protein